MIQITSLIKSLMWSSKNLIRMRALIKKRENHLIYIRLHIILVHTKLPEGLFMKDLNCLQSLKAHCSRTNLNYLIHPKTLGIATYSS